MKVELPIEDYGYVLKPGMFNIIFGLKDPITIQECSKKFPISPSTLYKYIKFLKEHNLIIVYDYTRYQSSKKRKRARYVCYISKVEITYDKIIFEFSK